MNSKKLVTFFRWSIIPAVITAYFIYDTFTYKGPKAGIYFEGFVMSIIIVFSFVINFFFFKIGPIGFKAFETPNNEIAKGIEGKVKIINVNYLNILINKYPLYELKLLVTAKWKEPYEILWKQVATPSIMINLKEGAEYPATIDAANLNNLEIKDFKKY